MRVPGTPALGFGGHDVLEGAEAVPQTLDELFKVGVQPLMIGHVFGIGHRHPAAPLRFGRVGVDQIAKLGMALLNAPDVVDPLFPMNLCPDLSGALDQIAALVQIDDGTARSSLGAKNSLKDMTGLFDRDNGAKTRRELFPHKAHKDISHQNFLAMFTLNQVKGASPRSA